MFNTFKTWRWQSCSQVSNTGLF